MAIKYTTEIFIRKAKKVHGNKYDYSLVEYVNSTEKIKIKCKKHGVFEQIPSSHLMKKGCKKCSTEETHNNQIKSTDMFIDECYGKFGKDKFDYSLVVYTGAFKKIDVICKKHGVFTVIARNHYKSNGGCNECRKEKLYNLFSESKESFIEKAKKIHKDKYDYFLVNYYNQATKVKIKCKKHDYIFLSTPNNHLRGKGCPICRSSKGENLIRNFLKNNNLKFEDQKKFKECKNVNILSFDFFLKQYNLLIEFQGEQHYKHCNVFHSKENKSLKIQQEIDQIKWQFAKDNNIKLLEIPYWEKENIDLVLKKELNL